MKNIEKNARFSWKSLPAAELHVHFEGTVRYQTYCKLAAKYKLSLDHITPQIFNLPERSNLNFKQSYPEITDFIDFIHVYLRISNLIRDEDDILVIGNDYLQTLRDENVVHAEIYFTPTTFVRLGADLATLFRGLAELAKQAKNKYAITLGFIFDIVRSANETGQDTIRLIEQAHKLGVPVFALGLAGMETSTSVDQYLEVFNYARSNGLVTLAHAGEILGPELIWETIRKLNPRRIGHGITAIQDQSLLKYLADSETCLEVSPWCNVALKTCDLTNHPIVDLVRAGVKVVLAADDPGIIEKSLNDNYMLASQLGLSDDELVAIRSYSLDYRSWK
ncbi:adenosine deaminase family protein [bacterium]|nr:adenosine deaminase family protein [bacterium]